MISNTPLEVMEIYHIWSHGTSIVYIWQPLCLGFYQNVAEARISVPSQNLPLHDISLMLVHSVPVQEHVGASHTAARVGASRATMHRCIKNMEYKCLTSCVEPLFNWNLTLTKSVKDGTVAQLFKVLFSGETIFISFKVSESRGRMEMLKIPAAGAPV